MRIFTPGQINRLKNEAKRLKKEKGIPHQRALDEIAIAQGWSDWCAMASASNQAPPPATQPTHTDVDRPRYFVHGDEDDEQPGQYYCEFCDRFEPAEHFRPAHPDDNGERTLSSLETWRKLPFDTKVQFFRPDKSPNLFQGAYPLPGVETKPRVRRSEASGMFHSWLCDQEWRPDCVGDFARYVRHDTAYPVGSDDVDVIRAYVRGATPQESSSFEEAWEDFFEAVGATR